MKTHPTKPKDFTNRAWEEFQKWQTHYQKAVEESLDLQTRLHEYAETHSRPFHDPVKAGLVLLSYLRGECEHIDSTGEYTPGYYCELCGPISNVQK